MFACEHTCLFLFALSADLVLASLHVELVDCNLFLGALRDLGKWPRTFKYRFCQSFLRQATGLTDPIGCVFCLRVPFLWVLKGHQKDNHRRLPQITHVEPSPIFGNEADGIYRPRVSLGLLGVEPNRTSQFVGHLTVGSVEQPVTLWMAEIRFSHHFEIMASHCFLVFDMDIIVSRYRPMNHGSGASPKGK